MSSINERPFAPRLETKENMLTEQKLYTPTVTDIMNNKTSSTNVALTGK